uniref:Uncharacterized protein n=1 Tax=Arcella intermedia TaxID=1963864 RepID=A0A6B2LUF1_9EUKA
MLLDFGEFPVFVAEGAHAPAFQPAGDAAVVEGVIASPGSHHARRFTSPSIPLRVRLSFNTKFHNMIPTNCTILHCEIEFP